jgi:O-antigen ligase
VPLRVARTGPPWQLLLLTAGAIALGWSAGIAPSVAVLAALGGAVAVLVLADLSLGLCLFALLGVMDILSKTGSSFSGTKVLGLVLLISWVAHLAARPRRQRGLSEAHPALVAFLVVFLTWTAVSMVWAPSVGDAATTLMRFALNITLFPIVFSAIRTRRHAMWLAGALVLAGAITVSYALLSGGAAVPTGELRGSARLDLKGGIGDPNELAAFLVVSAALAGALFASFKRHPLLRLACLGAAALSVAGIVLTVSRGGLIALIVMALAAIAFGGRWRPRILAGSLIVATTLVVYFVAFAPAASLNRITHPADGSGRNELWSLAWRMAQNHPLNGVGAGGFHDLTAQYLLFPGSSVQGTYLTIVKQAVVTHNMYLQILAELGIVGLLAFLGIVAISLLSFVKAAHLAKRRGDVQLELLARGMLVALLGLLAADFFLSNQFGKSLWILLAAGPALLAVARRSQSAAASTSASGEMTPNRDPAYASVVPAAGGAMVAGVETALTRLVSVGSGVRLFVVPRTTGHDRPGEQMWR